MCRAFLLRPMFARYSLHSFPLRDGGSPLSCPLSFPQNLTTKSCGIANPSANLARNRQKCIRLPSPPLPPFLPCQLMPFPPPPALNTRKKPTVHNLRMSFSGCQSSRPSSRTGQPSCARCGTREQGSNSGGQRGQGYIEFKRRHGNRQGGSSSRSDFVWQACVRTRVRT